MVSSRVRVRVRFRIKAKIIRYLCILDMEFLPKNAANSGELLGMGRTVAFPTSFPDFFHKGSPGNELVAVPIFFEEDIF